ncbi:hypothetical protein BgiMline_008465 [Biomphalaria glabrata]|nr:hypothetical protein BgiBS90_033972 [Biomphalaria glabrata]KAI8747561.1 hypothetical protein BgiMline_019279 [Biomphalaria glabrata]
MSHCKPTACTARMPKELIELSVFKKKIVAATTTNITAVTARTTNITAVTVSTAISKAVTASACTAKSTASTASTLIGWEYIMSSKAIYTTTLAKVPNQNEERSRRDLTRIWNQL